MKALTPEGQDSRHSSVPASLAGTSPQPEEGCKGARPPHLCKIRCPVLSWPGYSRKEAFPRIYLMPKGFYVTRERRDSQLSVGNAGKQRGQLTWATPTVIRLHRGKPFSVFVPQPSLPQFQPHPIHPAKIL